MTVMGTDSLGESLPLPALLSQLVVAFTIEFDNEFEHQMPHRTTRYGFTPGFPRGPWLVSMAMWVHCMRFVPEDGITAGELVRCSHLSAESATMVVKRMSRWWGYLVVEPNVVGTGDKPSRADWLVRPTPDGLRAQKVWEPLTEIVEKRWRVRFGDATINQLRASLWAIVKQFDLDLPDYLPVGEPRLRPMVRPPKKLGGHVALSALLSKVLLMFALEFEDESDLSLGIYTAGHPSRLAISANVLRVLDERGVRLADIPALSGVAKMTVDNWMGVLEGHRYLDVGAEPGSRFKVARLTAKGIRARDLYLRWSDTVGPKWQDRFGQDAVRSLQESAARMTLDPEGRALLWQGIQPYPDGWRAKLRPPKVLPHFPPVSYRGGFPDGS